MEYLQSGRQTFEFLKSENMAGIGPRLDVGYVPKPNDANVLTGVADKLHTLLEKVDNLVDEIKTHDQS